MTTESAPAATAGPDLAGFRELLRAALAPAACGIVLLALLASWVLSGGGGSISRVRVTLTGAAVPMTSYTTQGAAGRNALVYLNVRNLGGAPDELLAASSPDAARVIVTLHPSATGTPPPAVVTVPAGDSISLNPFGADLVLVRPRPLMAGQELVLRLRFRLAGTVAVQAVVTPPGTP